MVFFCLLCSAFWIWLYLGVIFCLVVCKLPGSLVTCLLLVLDSSQPVFKHFFSFLTSPDIPVMHMLHLLKLFYVLGCSVIFFSTLLSLCISVCVVSIGSHLSSLNLFLAMSMYSLLMSLSVASFNSATVLLMFSISFLFLRISTSHNGYIMHVFLQEVYFFLSAVNILILI